MSKKSKAKKRQDNSSPSNISAKPQSPVSPPPKREVTVAAAHFAGPLPPPEVFRQYDQILPGAAERILQMAERQANHRQSLEAKLVDAECRDGLLGLIFGLVIGLATILGGFYCIVQGFQLSGTALGLSGLTGLVGTFIYGSREKRKARQEAAQEKGTESKS